MDGSYQAWAREEEQLLERTLAALARASTHSSTGMRSTSELAELRAEAIGASEDDLPAVLHEMSVRHALRERSDGAMRPDPERPYFAHLQIEDEQNERRDYLLGYATFISPRDGVRIVDFRTAPIAQVFYRHREGDEIEEEIAGRIVTGVVRARRIVVIERGRLVQVIAGGTTIERDGDRFREIAAPTFAARGQAGPTIGLGLFGSRARDRVDVTALLDAEQHAAITVPGDEALLVIGSAGSGKTTVALHRLAHLVAIAPDRVPIERTRVIVPEEGLARLSRRLLEPLGASAATVQTLDDWAIGLARRVFGSLPPIADSTPAAVVALKRHPALFTALSRVDFDAPTSRSLGKLRRALLDLLTDRSFLGEVIAASNNELFGMETIVEHSVAQLRTTVERELAHVDADRKRTIDGKDIAEGTPDALAGTIDLEDLPIWLWLRSRHASFGESIAHLVLDEAEDFSLFELSVLGGMLDATRSVTVAGDADQQTRTGWVSWDRVLEALGARAATRRTLAVSYRCPRPVVELALAVLGGDPGEARAAREGAPVARITLPSDSHSQLFLVDALTELLEREPHAAVALIAADADAAHRYHRVLGELPVRVPVRLVTRGDFTFEPGLDITHVDSVKGLEFDYVVVPDAGPQAYPDRPEARRALHVAITRTTHQLLVVSPVRASPLLPG